MCGKRREPVEVSVCGAGDRTPSLRPTLRFNQEQKYIYLFIKKQREVSQCKTQRRDVAIRYKTLAACGPLVRVRVCAEMNIHMFLFY